MLFRWQSSWLLRFLKPRSPYLWRRVECYRLMTSGIGRISCKNLLPRISDTRKGDIPVRVLPGRFGYKSGGWLYSGNYLDCLWILEPCKVAIRNICRCFRSDRPLQTNGRKGRDGARVDPGGCSSPANSRWHPPVLLKKRWNARCRFRIWLWHKAPISKVLDLCDSWSLWGSWWTVSGMYDWCRSHIRGFRRHSAGRKENGIYFHCAVYFRFRPNGNWESGSLPNFRHYPCIWYSYCLTGSGWQLANRCFCQSNVCKQLLMCMSFAWPPAGRLRYTGSFHSCLPYRCWVSCRLWLPIPE